MKFLEVTEELKKRFTEVKDLKELDELRVLYMGKKGIITEFQVGIKDVPNEEKKDYGKQVNELRDLFTHTYEEKLNQFEEVELNKKLKEEKIDVTLPGRGVVDGWMHPLTKVIQELEELFISMGYDTCEGPEIEDDLHCFEMLNLPKNHPARDAQDTFYITEELLLRTQTSAMQVRFMESMKEKKPFRIIVPGKTYRRDDDDATHSHQFMQMEGLVIGTDISLADLKGTLEVFAKRMFGENKKIRFRPSFFPFTEPSYEVDISCMKCNGEGCSICKDTGWIEVLGSGMVHPNVLEACGFDSTKYQGFAFGLGIERIAMFKYGINNIRDFYTNDLRFNSNFNRLEGGNNNEVE